MYFNALSPFAIEFDRRGLKYVRQCKLPVLYKKRVTEKKYRVDFLVEDEVPVELKAVESLTNVHKAVAINYIKLANKKVGLLINCNVIKLIEGFHRYIV